jgi:predicted acylesterase/phospholipase RssA
MAQEERNERTGAAGVRVGLALSGGGFRASLFHIGVLAQMAQMGLLRRVEVISTVSGGSIIGALYYLHVKRLLEEKPDDAITDQDFQRIIERIEEDFLKGVQQNLRMRTFLNPFKTIRMAMATYSRSDRIGELYDEYFYRPVIDPNRTGMIQMRELKIQPKGAKDGFNPQEDNAGRKTKVPILLLNATCLNTGHNWRFEAVRMGEPPRDSLTASEIDKNMRLRRSPSYEAIIPKQQSIELGLAVAASACVPGLFTPLAISDLYPENIRVQLVDGGVHDNQGIQGLIDLECSHFIVSDSSGQMRDEDTPSTQPFSVIGRSNSILMDRVREEGMFRLCQDDTPVAFMHLLKGLAGRAVSWIGPDGQAAAPPTKERQPDPSPESFGVACEVQDLLSKIRTDLDSFTDVEAYSLMLDGYQMSGAEFQKTKKIQELTSTGGASPPRYRFLQLGPWMAKPSPAYLRQLKVGGGQVLKIFRLSLPATLMTGLVMALLFFALWKQFGPWLLEQLSRPVTLGALLMTVGLFAVGFIPLLSHGSKVFRLIRSPLEYVIRFVVRALLPAVGSGFVALHLFIFDRLFLRQGKVERLKPPD